MLESATAAFTRYGFGRTTMSDIAAGAGMSRPALYLLFPDKEAIFTRVIEAMDDAKHVELAALLAGPSGMADRLLAACLSWGLHGVELAEAHPDAVDLFDLRFPAVRAVYARFEALVAELIADAVAVSGLEARPDELARTLTFGMRGLRAGSKDLADMRRLVTVQVRAFTQAIGAAPARNA